MDGDLPEKYKCSICVEIPESEIYQCKNGHIICGHCVTGLSLCPQCNVSFGSTNIRNLALENLLDEMEFNCAFRSKGCSTTVTRREISTHHDHCRHGDDWIPLCIHLGYNCGHEMKFIFLQEYVQHLTQQHSIVSKNDQILEVRIPNMLKTYRTHKSSWKPILLKINSNHYLLVVQSNNQNISFTCIELEDDSTLQSNAKFRITSKKIEVPDLEWTMKPIQLNNDVSALKCPSLLVSLDSLFFAHAYVNQDVLKIEVAISNNMSSNIDFEKVVVELESHENQSCVIA